MATRKKKARRPMRVLTDEGRMERKSMIDSIASKYPNVPRQTIAKNVDRELIRLDKSAREHNREFPRSPGLTPVTRPVGKKKTGKKKTGK